MMHRTVSSSPLAPSVKVKLINAGFHTSADLVDLPPLQLYKEAGISQEEATEVLQTFGQDSALRQQGAAPEGLTALELLHYEQTQGCIVTFCSELDAVLGGGVSVGKTTEICGTPGIGKTQLCIQLAVDVQIPVCFGGLGGKAVYIDTEGGFLAQRAADMSKAAVEHCTLLAEDAEQQAALEDFTLEKILSNIMFIRCHDYVELLAEMYLLPDLLQKDSEVKLVVIDSIAFPFRHDFEDFSQRTRLLNSLALQLNQLANEQQTAVVVTNQMTTKISNGQSKIVPALGESWAHAATEKLILHWEADRRLASLYKSPSHREATVQYQIMGQGFRDTRGTSELRPCDPPPSVAHKPLPPSPAPSPPGWNCSKRPRTEAQPS